MKTKPCPFCCNPNAPENDVGGACCFCDYQGEVTIGKFGNFSTVEQYDKVYFATNHKDRLDELHRRNDNNRRAIYDINLEY
jgi:hypothetical protein